MQFRQRLQIEFAQRRERNAQYSLRAFARDLGTDHATLSQILRGRRNLSSRMVASLGRRLGLLRADVMAASLEQNAEAILRLARSGPLRPNSRWIATRTGIPLDGVNVALTRLLSERTLVMEDTEHWKLEN